MKLGSKVRIEVIVMSLFIEESLNKLLLSLFRIKNEKPKTLGHQSSAISFKTKIDFLYDLGRIETNIYKALQTFMEIRNQFAHSLSANTYEIVLERTGKRKYILDLVPGLIVTPEKSDSPIDYEDIYADGVRKLYSNIGEALIVIGKEIDFEIKKEEDSVFRSSVNAAMISALDEVLGELEVDLNKQYDSIPGFGKSVTSAIKVEIIKKMNEKYKF